MVPTSFDEANAVFDKPSSMSDEECESLSCLKTIMSNGYPCVISCWKVTREELEEINRTGRVWCLQVGSSPTPHLLSGTKPFEVISE